MNHKILMAFDFGMKRIGVALGQTITQSARPLMNLAAKSGVPDWQQLSKLVAKWSPDAFVVGIPLNMDGTEQPLTQQARQFAQSLSQKFLLPIYEVDERLTTKAAREHMFNTGGFKALSDGQVDAVAAQLILENWFAENYKKT